MRLSRERDNAGGEEDRQETAGWYHDQASTRRESAVKLEPSYLSEGRQVSSGALARDFGACG